MYRLFRFLSIEFKLIACLSVLAPIAGSNLANAAEPNDEQPLPAEQAARTMIVPDGFNVTLFAGEPDVRQPIGFCIDDRGRLWVAEAYNYPNHGTKAGDRIIIFEDSDGDGRHDKRTVFYDQLNYVTGIEVGFGGVWVMSPPYFYFIPDRDGDDKPDSQPVVLLDGFGNHANAHNLANGFAWGPDGWLYGTHGRTNWSTIGKPGASEADRVRFDGGVHRYHPVRHVWEPYADGTTNPWGIDWDDYGQAFITNCVNPHLFHVVPGAHYEPWRNRKSSEFAYERIPTIADHLHYTGTAGYLDGAGTEAEDAAGGGHAHCGTMIYLGDNWPDQYRNTLFTNNIHGRRINNDILRRSGSGYTASHGRDLMRSRDPWFMGVTLQYGPDGSVFVIDWSDTGECHSVRNTRRHTGRIYRIAYGNPQRPAMNLAELPGDELVRLQTHHNDWFVRHARRLLQERAAAGTDMDEINSALRTMLAEAPNEPQGLRAIWALHSTGGLDESALLKLLDNASEHVRTWAIQLLVESRVSGTRHSPFVTSDLALISDVSDATVNRFADLASNDSSPLVRLYLASALQRLPHINRWNIAESLVQHRADNGDANIPLMLWYGIEPLVRDDIARFARFAETSKLTVIRSHVARRIASLDSSNDGLDQLTRMLATSTDSAAHRDILDGILKGLEGRRHVDMPNGWSAAFLNVSSSSDNEDELMHVIRLALIYGDMDVIEHLQSVAKDQAAPLVNRRIAIDSLVGSKVDGFADMLIELISDEVVLPNVLQGLAEYNHPETVKTILGHYIKMPDDARRQAIQTLSSRREWAGHLLSEVESGRIDRADISAFSARQLRNLGDDRLNTRLNRVWGEVRATPKDRARRIAAFKQRLTVNELSHGDLSAGRVVFQKLCANCHRLFDSGRQVGPDITGAQRNNPDYILENLVDPSAQVSRDFQMEIIQTEAGRVITGLVKSETAAAVTVATIDAEVVVPVDEIEVRKKSSVSMMPEGQLKTLTFTQTRDLIAYLATSRQVPLPADVEGWTSLFNGQDLTGWRANVKPESFSVVDGLLKVHGRNGMSHLFYTGDDGVDDTFIDFEFEAEVRAEPNSNSGIFFHTDRELRKKKYLHKGYEVQLNSTAKEKRKTGSLYAVVDLAESPVDETKWFTLRFRVRGKHIEVWLNEQLVTDYTEPANPERPVSRIKRLIDPHGGAIAIQAHDPGSVFFFRSIRVRRLSAGE